MLDEDVTVAIDLTDNRGVVLTISQEEE